MSELPILLNTEMVRAVMDGRKTQIRWPIKGLGNSIHIDKPLCDWSLSGDPHQWDGENKLDLWNWCGSKPAKKGDWIWTLQTEVDDTCCFPIPCSYAVGDKPYVRETWQAFNKLSGSILTNGIPKVNYGGGFWVAYKADNIADKNKCKWRSSMHMPKWAARTWLKVTKVWAERIRSIDEAGVIAEGATEGFCLCSDDDFIDQVRFCGNCCLRAVDLVEEYQYLWEKRFPGSWERNDWCFCYEFEVEKRKTLSK